LHIIPGSPVKPGVLKRKLKGLLFLYVTSIRNDSILQDVVVVECEMGEV
jgi:hypothetical protein